MEQPSPGEQGGLPCSQSLQAVPLSTRRWRQAMEVRSNSRLRLAIVAIVAVAAVLALGALPAAAARRARRAKAAEPSAVPLDQIHVLGDRPAPFGLDAKAAMMVDARSGATLYAYNEHEKIQPASLAKLMTFYLVLKALHQGRITPDTMVTVSEKAWRLSMNSGVSRMFLQVGQRVSVNDLLFGLMVSSGNDAAVALAEYLGGSSEAFAEQMNQKARRPSGARDVPQRFRHGETRPRDRPALSRRNQIHLRQGFHLRQDPSA